MKVGLIADTQGRFDIDGLLKHVAEEFREVDEIWHAGDWGYPEVLTGLAKLARLVVVNGNAPDDPRYPRTMEGRIGRWRVGMVHALDKQPAGWAGRFDVVIHAHSHRWRDEVVDRIRFINPGTATRPQFGGTERTMARLTFGERLVVQKLVVPRFAEVPAI
jgi:putative phosphoesterase